MSVTVVQTTESCVILLTELGFYAMCRECLYTSKITPAKYIAVQQAEAHDGECPGEPPAAPRPAIPRLAAGTPEYRKKYTNGWNASRRWGGSEDISEIGGTSPIERADDRNEPHAWYDGWEDYAAGRDKWAKMNERLDGDHEPEEKQEG